MLKKLFLFAGLLALFCGFAVAAGAAVPVWNNYSYQLTYFEGADKTLFTAGGGAQSNCTW